MENQDSTPLERRPRKCDVCSGPTTRRCGRCKAATVCSKECFKIYWPKHKKDCDNIAGTAQLINDNNVPTQKTTEKEMFFQLTGDDAAIIQQYNSATHALYTKYDIEEPPTRNSTMPVRAKIEFFLEHLELYDTSSPKNATVPLPVKLFLNRRYNNTYKHALEHFTAAEHTLLDAQMRARKIGAAYQ